MSTRVLAPEVGRTLRAVQWESIGGSEEAPVEAAETSPPPAPDIEAIRKQAYSRGVEEGRRAGEKEAGARLQPLTEKLSSTITALIGLRSSVRRQAEVELVRLAFAIARRVVNRELTVDPTAVHGLLNAALAKLESHEICRIQTHPDQQSVVQSWVDAAAPARRVRVDADGKLKPWDILFETENGKLDASVETQFAEIERGFADRSRS